ncbi:polysaccharide deacetylase [Paenibacillus sp. UNC499MF]|uniref:polysaccharide deacetylase n=1 Tax=Paenibacillus sp. UNC499MF TaxID=1502751 RepID=UPI0008A05ABE|nr:polysaccharide deacetylase [Paenibacillus sp. UNC499MF]SEG53970.1 Peptidoglycan/xylan/chitin deacetylase, PgdA/CDA1 family [Paenibacillus sp. UNC499MF]
MLRTKLSHFRFTRIALILLLIFVAFPSIQPVQKVYGAEADAEPAGNIYEAVKSGSKVASDQTYAVPDKPTVYLTFDDGPSKYTPEVLDILGKEGVPASFFVVGEHVEDHPGLVKRIVSEGHALGNHSYDHTYKKLYSDYKGFWKQVEQTDRAIEKAAGFRTGLMRAPGGTAENFDAFYFYYMKEAGYTLYDWDIDSEDSKRTGVPAAEIIRSVRKAPLKHELTVLFHDGTGHKETVKALPEVIRYFRDKGYAFAKLDDRVKPAQFPVREARRWQRSTPGEADFARTAAAMREWAAAVSGGRPPVLSGEEAAVGAGSVRPRQAEPRLPLTLTVDGRRTVLPPEQALFREERLEVLLRVLAQQLGAKVDWNQAASTASIDYGFTRLDYNLRDYTLSVRLWAGVTAVYHLPNMRLLDGSLYVPLRKTVELLGGGILDYHADGSGREVTISGGTALFSSKL